MKILLTLFLFVISVAGFGQTKEIQTNHKDSVQALVRALRGETMIASKYVGMAGSPSRQWVGGAWLASIASTEELLVLVKDKTPLVRYYGYIGLVQQQYKGIRKISDKLSKDPATVSVMTGCIVHETTLGNAIRETAGWYDKNWTTEFKDLLQQNPAYSVTLFDEIVNNKPVTRLPESL